MKTKGLYQQKFPSHKHKQYNIQALLQSLPQLVALKTNSIVQEVSLIWIFQNRNQNKMNQEQQQLLKLRLLPFYANCTTYLSITQMHQLFK
ncbi:unnamed protein product (macronuclear) [Paramecium tetraurelia]|uniref:Uncharacterized protein n=1 Tax=Paramecium tetraurelia TaxID=5888 RepID=A0DUS2_PARTE|nr:uncharacterized protein GSPATT00039777001 [Paramecium tetraurelia]CAK86789.1 unnamed protein product [Paramecium tetraurelia]|eukprot:XP_001454186.1 hypothetical protein (macronuclear) [Paramecium tetraurelia strain d4-2]